MIQTQIDVAPEMVRRHDVLHILSSSLQDQPQEGKDRAENEVRYKLIVDPSEDDSLVRLLFAFGVLERQNTRMFICSDFPGDGQLQKVCSRDTCERVECNVLCSFLHTR